jgi:spore photoproduct lyase
VIFESRTKSAEIAPILSLLSKPAKNFELAFSLNPEIICEQFEKGAASLEKRITAIRSCLDAGIQVGLRFLPLLPIPDYKNIYQIFLTELAETIDFSTIHSIFLGPILYTRKDFQHIQKLYPHRDLWERMEDAGDGFVRVKSPYREELLEIFKECIGERVVQFG